MVELGKKQKLKCKKCHCLINIMTSYSINLKNEQVRYLMNQIIKNNWEHLLVVANRSKQYDLYEV